LSFTHVVAESDEEDLVTKQFPLFCHFNANPTAWFHVVAGYFDVELALAKQLFRLALNPNGKQTAIPDSRQDWLPRRFTAGS